MPYNSQSALTEYENEIEEANQLSNINYNIFSNPLEESPQSPLNIENTNISSNENYNVFSNPQNEISQTPLNAQNTNFYNNNMNQNIPLSPMHSTFSGKLYEPRTYKARSLINRRLLI